MDSSDHSSSDTSTNSFLESPLTLEHRNSFNIDLSGEFVFGTLPLVLQFESRQENQNTQNGLKRLSCPNFMKDSKKNSLIDNSVELQLARLASKYSNDSKMEIEQQETQESDYSTPKTSSINHILGQIRTNQMEGRDAPVLDEKLQKRIDQLQNAPCRQNRKQDSLDL